MTNMIMQIVINAHNQEHQVTSLVLFYYHDIIVGKQENKINEVLEMEIIDVTPNTQKDWERIYTEAFPEYEQRPMAELVTLVEQQDAIKMQVIVDDQTIVGVVYLCEIGLSKAFLLYFAIDATIQSKGYGSRALATLKERYKDGVILEAEQVGTQAENEEQRTRRYDFYMRNGLEDKQLLSENSGGVFHLLASTPDISATEYLQAMHAMSIEAIVRRDD